MKNFIIISLIIFCSGNVNAQFWKDKLNEAKENVQRKAENKLNEKINKTIDKGIDGVDDAISGKKSDKRKSSKNSRDQEAESTNDSNTNYNESADVSSNEMIITTNIKCEKGKELMEELIRNQRNVMSVSIDKATGKVYVSIDNNDNQLKENTLKLISENGFSANGKQPKTKNNVCK